MITNDPRPRLREANWWPTVLQWGGVAFLSAGMFTGQFFEIAGGLLALVIGAHWAQHNLHSGKARSVKVG